MTKTFKTSAIIADLTSYLSECEKFEKDKIIKEKHVSSQIIQLPNPDFHRNNGKLHLPGIAQQITTVMISIIYVHEVQETVMTAS